jgi:very-short-patch-repair endonuclease
VAAYQSIDEIRVFRPDDAGDLEFLLFRQDGVISRRQALRYLSDKAIRHRLAAGRWLLAHRAVYLTQAGPVSAHQRRWIAALAVGRGRIAPLGGLSALAVHGLRGFPSGPIHVLVGAHRRDTDPPRGVVVHRTRHLPAEDRHPAGNPPCTMPARSMIDAAQWASTDREAATIVAACFQQRLVSLAEVERAMARLPRVHRRPVIVAAVADAAGGAESIFEIDFARMCRRAGLPEPSRQVARTDRAGRQRYRDVYFDRWAVHVEIDGGQHMDIKAWYADMRQHNEIAIAGERLLRFPGWALRQHPDEVLADVRAALTAAGWRQRSRRVRGGRAPAPVRGEKLPP